MKKINALLLFLLLSVPLAWAALDYSIPNNILSLGDGAATADKELVFNMGDGASNPKINIDFTNKDFDFNASMAVSGSFTSTGLFDSLGLTMSAVNQMNLGDGTDSDFSLIVDRAGVDPFLKWSETDQAFVFSNDGTTVKKIGSGGGGEGGGINLLVNSSFEDTGSPILNWTNSGGTFTQETFTNSLEDDEKFARFVATGAGQYIESDVVTRPEDFGFGMMSDIRYSSGSSAFRLTILDSTGAIEYTSSSFSDLVEFDKLPTQVIQNLPAGSLLKMRITSTGAGTINLNKAYLGSNKGFISADDINSGSARIQNNGTASILSQQNDFIASVARTGLGIVTVTFKAGVFSVPPSVVATLEDPSSGRTTGFRNLSISSVDIVTSNDAAATEDRNLNISMTKQGADSVSTQEAFTPEQANFFISANIGGANIGMSGLDRAEITNAGLNMVLNNGSAKIPCSGTNPSTGLTCSVGSPGIGIVFNNPVSGRYKICMNINTDNGASTTWFKMVHTENSSQSIIQEGVVGTQHSVDVGAVRQCDFFDLNSVGEKTIRLFADSSAGNTLIVLDRGSVYYDRDMNITVELVQNNVARPVIQNMVDTSVSEGVRTNACRIDNNSVATINNESGLCDWIDSVSRTSLGIVQINFKTGTFSQKPRCFPTITDSSPSHTARANLSGDSSSRTIEAGNAATNGYFDLNFEVFCIGAR